MNIEKYKDGATYIRNFFNSELFFNTYKSQQIYFCETNEKTSAYIIIEQVSSIHNTPLWTIKNIEGEIDLINIIIEYIKKDKELYYEN